MKEDGKEKVDDRFGDLFIDKAFQIDEESERYNQLKPVCMYKCSKSSLLSHKLWAKHVSKSFLRHYFIDHYLITLF